METITDRKGFNINFVKDKRVKAFVESVSEKEHKRELYSQSLLAFRNAVLEIFPNNNGKYDDLSVKFAENSALIFCEKFLPLLTNYIDKELETIKQAQQKPATTLPTAT